MNRLGSTQSTWPYPPVEVWELFFEGLLSLMPFLGVLHLASDAFSCTSHTSSLNHSHSAPDTEFKSIEPFKMVPVTPSFPHVYNAVPSQVGFSARITRSVVGCGVGYLVHTYVYGLYWVKGVDLLFDVVSIHAVSFAL